MEIKELHLRNIASIVEADIDFEKGLCDAVTGAPASIFLISGDTGVGKSILLDGLSMALYKNTPRISGVANIKKNEFTDAEGESIRVGSIEQYTRLGISEKDECFSEVVFVGNDGTEYRARLELGMLLSNTDKTSGKRVLKHRATKWKVKIGSADWTTDNVAKTIEDAVGLSFEQFGRMAMLAQGQFATFLTGDKKEREAILEQLTNTERFSKYGEAIKRLHDKAKAEVAQKKTEYDTELEHTLPQDEVNRLIAERTQLEADKKALEDCIRKNGDTLSLVNDVETARKRADAEARDKKELEEKVASEEYKGKNTLVADWEATVTERQRLLDLKAASRRIAQAQEEAAKQKAQFTILSADLLARREAIKSQLNPQKAVEKKQEEIDALTASREGLNPAGLIKDLEAVHGKMEKIRVFSSQREILNQSLAAVAELEKEIAGDEKTLKEKEKALGEVQAEYDEAKKVLEEASARYVRMNVSREEALKELRHRLAREHADICPLCGQHIETIPGEEVFSGLLLPLEEEQKIAADRLNEINGRLRKVNTDFDKFSGALERKRKGLISGKEKNAECERCLWEKAALLGLKEGMPVEEQVASILQELSKEENRLKGNQEKAEEIQKSIRAALDAKKPLDEALRRYEAQTQLVKVLDGLRNAVLSSHPEWDAPVMANQFKCADITTEWQGFSRAVSETDAKRNAASETVSECEAILNNYYSESGKTEADLMTVEGRKLEVTPAKAYIKNVDEQLRSKTDSLAGAEKVIRDTLGKLGVTDEKDIPEKAKLLEEKETLKQRNDELSGKMGGIESKLADNSANITRLDAAKKALDEANANFDKWSILNGFFGGSRFRTLVQTYILRPLLKNANIYLERITDRYRLTCSEDNEQLSILVLDRYNKDQIRSVTVLSGGERFMISLALSLALSSLNRPDMNVNILFIDEGFGTLDEKSLDSVMQTLEKLQEIAGESNRRVGIISHREGLEERIPVKIQVKKRGEGRSYVEIINTI